MKELLKLIKCEFLKLKRLRFIQITLILAVLFPIVLTMYVFKTGNNFEMLYRFVFLYGDLLFKPCVLGIIGLMLLSTEDDNDTFKNLLSIPISGRKLFYAKISLLLLLSMLYSFFELLATSIGGLFLGGIQDITTYAYHSLINGTMIFFDVLPLILLFCIFHRNKIFSIILTIFYAIAGFLLVNAYASGLSVSSGFISSLPRIVAFRWFLYVFSLEQNSATLFVPELSTVKAFQILICTGVVFIAFASGLYGRKEVV